MIPITTISMPMWMPSIITTKMTMKRRTMIPRIPPKMTTTITINESVDGPIDPLHLNNQHKEEVENKLEEEDDDDHDGAVGRVQIRMHCW
mmetsp:Transcript_20023/g.42331  ORF Transcript_20023/g.42331 Transcript_20023/m.42331 type:complete len:90 (+) Transcript_20023:1952-2221(+)